MNLDIKKTRDVVFKAPQSRTAEARRVYIDVCVRVRACACLSEWKRGVCAVCVGVCACVFSFKRRKTTVVTERSRKISYQIAEPTLVPRGLKAGSGVHH